MDISDQLFDDDYIVPGKSCNHEIRVKRSRFICSIIPVETKESAEKEYQKICKRYFDATHNCFAYRISKDLFRYSDAGEPSGTAGKPIFQAIEGKNIFETLCVVTRYFGGTKLGTGGLVRAYSEVTQQTLEKARLLKKTRFDTLTICYDYAYENIIRRVIDQFHIQIIGNDYSNNVEMKLNVPQSKFLEFKNIIAEFTQSTVTFL